jgi:hypothetical protein
MHNVLFFIFLVLGISIVAGELDENTARLLLYKVIHNFFRNDNSTIYTLFQLLKSTPSDIVVEGQDFLVSYQIINTGNAAATKIEVSDRYDPAR